MSYGLVCFLLVVNEEDYANGTNSGAGEGELRCSRHYAVVESFWSGDE